MKIRKAAFFLLQMLFKSEKTCYNRDMKDRKTNTNEGFLSSLIGEKTPSKRAGLTYTVAALAIFAVSFLFLFLPATEGETPEWKLYLNFLGAPLAFLFVLLWYFIDTKTPVKDFIKEQNCHPKYYLIAIILQVGLFGLSELNVLFLSFLEKFGYVDTGIDLPSMEGFGFVGVFLTVAILPAFMEELVFRGVFLRETKDFSLVGRVLLCGALFALYHQNPAQTVYQFICGAAFALVAIKSGSFLPTALSHLINNGLILTLAKFGIDSFNMPAYAIILAVSGVCLVGSLIYLLAFYRKEEEKGKGSYKQFFACAAIGIFMLLLSWSAMLLTGF